MGKCCAASSEARSGTVRSAGAVPAGTSSDGGVVLIDQRVADEIAALVARHRYGVEDGRDAVRSAEQAAQRRNAQLAAEAAERRAALPGLAPDLAARPERRPERPQPGGRALPNTEIRIELEDDEPEPPQRASRPAPPTGDEPEEDFSTRCWLQ